MSRIRRKTDAEMQRDKVIKTTRTLIRLKHSLAADEELNEVLPDTVDEFEASFSRGNFKKLKVNLSDVLEGRDVGTGK